MTTVTSLIGAPAGSVRVRWGNDAHPHPADGMVADVCCGDGAVMTISNPAHEDGGPEWTMRYGKVDGVRYAVAALIESYDYLLSEHITMKEATRRLRTLRAARAAIPRR